MGAPGAIGREGYPGPPGKIALVRWTVDSNTETDLPHRPLKKINVQQYFAGEKGMDGRKPIGRPGPKGAHGPAGMKSFEYFQ